MIWKNLRRWQQALPPWLALKVSQRWRAPRIDGYGASTCHAKALQLAGLQLADIDLIEANEALPRSSLPLGKPWALILRK